MTDTGYVRKCLSLNCEKNFDQAKQGCSRNVCPFVLVRVLQMTPQQFRDSFEDTQPVDFNTNSGVLLTPLDDLDARALK